ncbi:MATH and LRR domain-containing protein PFE0570w isoform X2 [Diachasmimorpha longicaudata]|uniref:MATH and LRR domain-containing protein PFE0570w isoform X2 n=1 Tax=Diachasmimorpha longicaudata TaxID=58733 RepID=UPI0030B88FD5
MCAWIGAHDAQEGQGQSAREQEAPEYVRYGFCKGLECPEGHNDIKKLRRENEQLRREIWCLREEYDKLEEILKSQKSREDSENDEDLSDDCSSGSNQEEDDDDEEEEDSEDEISDPSKSPEKLITRESIQDELLENAENQKLSTEKMNSIHRLHVDFDKLSTVTEEDETKRDKIPRKKDERELIKAEGPVTNEISQKREDSYLTGHTFNWIYSPECPVQASVNDQSVCRPQSPSIQHLISNDAPQLPPLGWEAIFDVNPRTNSTAPRLLPEELTLPLVCDNSNGQKTSPDICVSGAVPNQLHNSQSSDNLLSNQRDNLDKSLSHSCQELKSNLFRDERMIKGGLAAKSLPDNSKASPKAFRSQLRVHLTQPSEKLPDVPPQMPRLDCTLCPPTSDDRRHRRLLRQLQLQDYQATSFEHPNPQSLTLPVSMKPFIPRPDKTIYRDIDYLPVWSDVPPPPRVDTQTQTQSPSPTPSSSSGQEVRKDDGKSLKSSKSSPEKKRGRKKSERLSTPSMEGQRKQKNRNSQASKRRTSSRSQSIPPAEGELKNFKDTIAGGIEAEKEFRKNSIATEKVPWCACWGNGCL